MDNLLMCSLCNVSYALYEKIPKILSCGETFCLQCLSELQHHGGITCVDCGVITILSDEGVNGLPTNNTAKKLALQLSRMSFL